MPMFIKIGQEFQCLEDKIRIPMLTETGPEFHCLEGKDGKENGWVQK